MPALALPAFWGAVSAGAGAGATLYGVKKSGESNDRASALQAKANADSLALAQQQEAERKAEFNAQQAEAKRQWDIDQANKQPRLAAQNAALMRLSDMLHLPGLTASTGNAGASSSSAAGSAADLKALIDSGVDPQAAAQQFNKTYGRTTGNEAVYYDPAQHGGVATIGLPDAYLSLEPNGWGITQRGGTSRALPSSASLPSPAVATASAPATQPNYQGVIPFAQLLRGVR